MDKEEETTIWKKNRLEEKDLANGEQYNKIEEFQNNTTEFPEIIQVERKITKINKKRKGFSKNPILESIYDVDEYDYTNTNKDIIENFETTSKKVDKKVDKKNESQKKTKIQNTKHNIIKKTKNKHKNKTKKQKQKQCMIEIA